MTGLAKLFPVLLLGLSLTGTAVAAPPVTDAASQTQLPLAGLAKTRHRGLEEVFVRPGIDLASYGRIKVEAITFDVPIPDIQPRRHEEYVPTPRDADHATSYFGRRLAFALGRAGKLEGDAGNGLVMTVSITDFRPNNPGNPWYKRRDYVTDSIGIGRVAFTAVLTDARTREVVAVLQDRDTGLSFNNNPHLSTEWGDADQIMGRWARQIEDLFKPDEFS